MSGDFGQCSEFSNDYVFVSAGYLPRDCHIDLSYIQHLFCVIYYKKNLVGGHVGRDARIRKPPTFPRPGQDLPGKGCRGLSVSRDTWAAMYVKLTI